MVQENELQAKVTETAGRLKITGVSVGVVSEDVEQYAVHGVTSVENPVPVTSDTLFQIASATKPFTATLIVRLVDQGHISLEEPVRTYVPELRLQDEQVAREVTVMHLLNHSAGWAGDLEIDTGEGDDAIAKFVERMAELEQQFPLGEDVAYNNASLCLAGRIVERVTRMTYERALKELILDPVGLRNTYLFPKDIMTRKFAVGHSQGADGTFSIVRPWGMPRALTPAGGIVATAADLIAWARFHLNVGRTQDGGQLLSRELVDRMQHPTVQTPGSALGDAIGIVWLLREADGVRLVSHAGSGEGVMVSFLMAPERRFAIAALTNCSPAGQLFNQEIAQWALLQYAQVDDREPEPLILQPRELERFTGRFENPLMVARITPRDGGLLLQGRSKVDDSPPSEFPLGLLPGGDDRYLVTDGPFKGMKGYFVCDADGKVEAIHLGGRLTPRTGPVIQDA